MTLDLGPVSSLATALGLLTSHGDPNPEWFGHPEDYLATMLAEPTQREALVAFVDDALGGEDRSTDAGGVVWLPVVSLEAPQPLLDVAVVIDDTLSDDYVALGLGLAVRTTDPRSRTTIHVPLFRAAKKDRSVADPFLLGAVGGRIQVATEVTVGDEPVVPGQAHLGSIGLALDVPTAPGDTDPVFSLTLRGVQLPGASSPRDITVGGTGLDDLDDAVLDLVLSLVRAQLDGAAGTPLHAVGGLLGLVDGDPLPDFPVTGIAQRGVAALAAWLHDLLTVQAQRDAWVGYLASLLGATAVGDAVSVDLGPATVTLRLRVDTGPTGNPVIRPTLSAAVVDGDQRAEASAELCTVDLVTGAATALPSLGVWAATGRPVDGHRVLHLPTATPSLDVDTLRIGFALDAARRLTFVLAADGVQVGDRPAYPTLDLTSPDAVMDAAGKALEDVADDLLGGLGDALRPVQVLLGLSAPTGAPPDYPAVSVADLLTDPLAAVTAHWRTVLADHRAQVDDVLTVLKDALADAAADAVSGTGTEADPWRLPLVGPLALQAFADGARLVLDLAIGTRVDTLGQHCTVIETTVAARLAELDLEHRTGSMFTGVEARLHGRENGVEPSRARLPLVAGAAVQASYVGIRFGWTPAGGLRAAADLPDLRLVLDDDELPVALPVVGTDGSVTLPPEARDALQELVARISALLPTFLGDLTALLGWTTTDPSARSLPVLRLADLVSDAPAALAAWVPRLLLSELGDSALALLADLLTAAGPASGLLRGTGHPDDPYVLDLQPGLPVPELAVWFPPEGLQPRLTAVPDDLRAWRPGRAGLAPERLAEALRAEAGVDPTLRDLVEGRPLVEGLGALTTRWVGSDGRIVPPAGEVTGVTVRRRALAFGQLLPELDLEDELGRAVTTVVHVAVADTAAAAWPGVPADRLIDLTTPGLAPAMVTPPSAATGAWYVALGSRTACRLPDGDDDGTAGQAARLSVVLQVFAGLGPDLVVVGVGGAGHAARLAAQTALHVSDVVLLGTPLGPVSLTVLDHQPEADTLRLLHRLLPAAEAEEEPGDEPDADLPLARGLLEALVTLTASTDPARDLRVPATALPVPRAGLDVTAVFGVVDRAQVDRAVTAVVAAGLAARAQDRATRPVPRATGVRAGLRLALPPSSTGALDVSADGVLTLASFDAADGLSLDRSLRVRCSVADRQGWLTSTADVELRKVTVDVDLPLGGTPGRPEGTTTVVLHDARVLGRSWERLVLGTDPLTGQLLPDGLPPEARVLLASAVQRLTSDATSGGVAAAALTELLRALSLVQEGGAAFDAFDQLVHDPAGLVRARLVSGRSAVSSALDALLGPVGAAVSLDGGSVTVEAGSDGTGLFGWAADVEVSPAGLTGTVRIGPSASTSPAGALQLVVDLAPFAAHLDWHHPGHGTDVVALWPDPDGAALARTFAAAAPSLAGHVALEIMRRADETAQPVIDAALDAVGLLSGAATDAERHLRPLAGLLADPAGWLRSADSLASSPAKVQGLLDALRPLLGVAGAPGDAWQVAEGVSLGVSADGPDVRLALAVDSGAWDGAGDRVRGGVAATVTVGTSGPPRLGLDAHVGLPDGDAGRQAVHAAVDATGTVSLLLRPASGPDIVLLPFAGLGGLAQAATRVLPFVLDKLAELDDPVGGVVATLGDGLGLRTAPPDPAFDADRIATFAADPVAALAASAARLVAAGLPALAGLVDDLTPSGVQLASAAGRVTATVGDFTLAWDPTEGSVGLSADGIAVPGIEALTGTVRVSAAGLEELSVTVGPAEIHADTAVLRPFVTVAAGLSPAGGRRVLVGLAVDDTHRFAARWLLDPTSFALVGSDGPLTLPVDDPTTAALRAVEVLADLVVAVAMATDAVGDILDTAVFDSSVRKLLAGVLLEDAATPTALLDGVFDTTTIEARLARLFRNIADAQITFTVDGQLELSLVEQDGVVGLRAGLLSRWALNPDGDLQLWLENDDSWIDDNPAGDGGLVVGFLDTSAGLDFKPSLAIWGVGLRIGKSSGPLLDAGVTIESVALHTYAELDLGGAKAGGVQLELTNLALSVSGASGGNSIASGIVRDTGPQPPRPAFSPALAIQKHGSGAVEVTLRAGPGDGPWWIAIQKGFGPLYLEQLGLGVVMPSRRVESISLLIDGSVSLFGLQCQVDDLQITYLVSKDDFFNPHAWDIDLAGLAVSADMAGLTLAGGLLKQSSPAGIEYLGMLLARFGVYGITIYGGYGEGDDHGEKFVAFFAVGSVVGPIGGPPAFFLTGIGGGFGINRELVVPTDLSKFGDYPLIKALDVAAKPGNPMDELRALGQWFPMKRGTFWFAAGLSFNSFALVDGIAVVAVEVGDGLDVNLLGLARMALPRPQAALVSIEIALLVRFSTSEGVLWVQGQLTDNSWLLVESVRLTGGFAFVTWFKGPHRGEFVLTLGGFHPDFHRDGYPVVPRLGLRVTLGPAVITAGTYFALTSEAVMAGGDFEASAELGPAWAKVGFGAHGIVYFDPFRYQVMAYARIDAGVTIDLWLLGEVTIRVHLGARIEVEGPDFHGKARFEVGPVGVTVEFGSSEQTRKELLAANDFVAKYLEPSADGAVVLSVVTTYGVQPSGAGRPTADGTPDRPFVVVCEFGLILTSTVPLSRLSPDGRPATDHAPSRVLGVAPMGQAALPSAASLHWMKDGTTEVFPFVVAPRTYGAFPVGVWGPPQDDNNRKVPDGEVIAALHEATLEAHATESEGGPSIPYYQVEIGKRIPLPFKRKAAQVARLRDDARKLAQVVTQPGEPVEAFALARKDLARVLSPTSLAALAGERQAPPRAGSLGEGLDAAALTVVPDKAALLEPPVVDAFVDPPVAVGLLRAATPVTAAVTVPATTVKDSARAWRTAPPTLASVDAERSRSIAASLSLVDATATPTLRAGVPRVRGAFDTPRARSLAGSVVATGAAPTTAVALGAVAQVARVGNPTDGLAAFTAGLTTRRVRGTPGAALDAGQLAVLRLPNARRDVGSGERPRLAVSGAPARVVVVGHGGGPLVDTVTQDGEVEVPAGAERVVVVGQGTPDDSAPVSLDGWHTGMQLPYLGWSTALARDATVQSVGQTIADHRERLDAGWVSGAELAAGLSTVVTRFREQVRVVAVVLDDPTAFGDQVAGRRLVLGLTGATRVRDADGQERKPVVVSMGNRSVLAYDVVPDGAGSVTVTVATEQGWSLVGVLGSARLDGEGAAALVAARGLDASLGPLADGPGRTALAWRGETRSPRQRAAAKAAMAPQPPVRRSTTRTRGRTGRRSTR